MMMSSDTSEKRKRGRPKGTKNKPDAGTNGRPVGRPRKDASTLKTAPPKLPQKTQPPEKENAKNSEGAYYITFSHQFRTDGNDRKCRS